MLWHVGLSAQQCLVESEALKQSVAVACCITGIIFSIERWQAQCQAGFVKDTQPHTTSTCVTWCVCC